MDHSRLDQAFFTLTDAEIDRLRQFGEERSFPDGERLLSAGTPSPGMFILLKGHVEVSQRDGAGRRRIVVRHGPRDFLAEVGQLSAQPALVDAWTKGDVEALVISSVRLRALIIAEASLGERITRALILRRVGLLNAGHGGPLLIGASDLPAIVRLRNFLRRNGYPHQIADPSEDQIAADILAKSGASPSDLPLVVVPSGEELWNPSIGDLARALGLVGMAPGRDVYDVAIVGAGPAGLAAAVYAASEGLSVAVLDAHGFGGQAEASARIENYLGFPTGITGQALTARAYVQAVKFGAEIMMPVAVRRLICDAADKPFRLETEHGTTITARTVVVASGARYRRPAIPLIERFEGKGIWYWASPIEARLCAGAEVALVGGGNSAGQAAVYLSQHAALVTMMVRAPSLAASMSRYLIERIEAAPNIRLLCNTEITGLGGEPDQHLESLTWTDRATGISETRNIRNLFLFVGADPETGWLADCDVELDRAGFVLTGSAVSGARPGKPNLEASVPGVFAIGDARSGSVKRVGGAIGEGAAVVAAIHAALALDKAAH